MMEKDKVAPDYLQTSLHSNALDSSDNFPDYLPNYARLRMTVGGKGAWCADSSKTGNWLQVREDS